MDGNAVGYCAEPGNVDLADPLGPGRLANGKHIDGGGPGVYDEQPLVFGSCATISAPPASKILLAYVAN